VLRDPFVVGVVERFPYAMSGSVGVANGDRASAADLLRDADIALYEAKALGKNRFVVFEPAMQTAVEARVEMEMDLRRALDEGQLSLVYQPTLDLAKQTVTGVEALLRWKHPRLGTLQPGAFTALAEDTGMIVEIDRWVLREATRQTRAWQGQGLALGVAVKVSARQLDTGELVAEVGAALTQSGLDPAALTLEVTEATIMRDVPATAGRLAALKTLGVRIAIDDFGTGYSSLANLRRLPVDVLKIDGSLISGVAQPSDAGELVAALVALGRILGIDTVSHGTDDRGQQLGVDGPLAAGAIPSLLATWDAVSR
jgi:predicted signal transduction protein with EAL and GGDEF domain